MKAYYNEVDSYCAEWLKNLIAAGHIAPGDVDTRSIKDVAASDLHDYSQCHFFAGIGGWSLAFRLSGWPDSEPAWTGSCPCQPFSSATRGRTAKFNDDRHLWPYWAKLIRARQPSVVFGEQVATAKAWLDGVSADLEDCNYTIRAAILPAYAASQNHARARIYFAGYSDSYRQPGFTEHEETSGLSWNNSLTTPMEDANGLPTRVGKLRAYGNAIVPQVAAAFIEACRP